MIPINTIEEAATFLGRNLTEAETFWFNYSARKSDYYLYCHNILFLFLIFTFVPLPLVFVEMMRPLGFDKYKIQPKVSRSFSEMFRCYKDVMRTFVLLVGPLQLASFLHGKWGYEKIHRVHHEYSASIAFAAPYAHWLEVLILGVPTFLGPAIVPGHMITFWLWIALRYDFHWTPTKYIPFYGGADYHDYHHYVGQQSQSNFASVFTYCDYIYGTDKGYRYHKKVLRKLKSNQESMVLRMQAHTVFLLPILNWNNCVDRAILSSHLFSLPLACESSWKPDFKFTLLLLRESKFLM
ncbi:Methylsterol monooxygenase 1-3 [Hibiscus syriacus]|uniref:Methylsterol monooxygenase 1-3 n=1 Tax=Hibiscus syriacus TaxID=106335 RepID=A0A6A3CG40_HIBSY|nr:Methylsterol monooxygenase 1-3 [Hibiscus syriacus]